MHGFSISRLLSPAKGQLARALALLAPHFAEINSNWRRLMGKAALNADEVEALSGTSFEAQRRHLAEARFEAYRRALERRGRILARRGIPEEHAAAALALYLESCLPYLAGPDQRALRSALVRLTCAGQISLGLGYAGQRTASWRALEQRLRQMEERLQGLSAHITNVYEQERRRISHDLHDEIGHNLIVLKLYMEMIALDLKSGRSDQASQKLEEAIALVAHSIDGVRRLAFDLGPAIVDELGFVPALKLYARQFAARTGIKVRVEARLGAKLPASYEMALYRVLQGALSNVAEHSRASNVRVVLRGSRQSVRMAIEDDGIGFDVRRKLRAPHRAFGLLAMRERIERLGGRVRVESRPAKRRGTKIEVDLPLQGIKANEQENKSINLRRSYAFPRGD